MTDLPRMTHGEALQEVVRLRTRNEALLKALWVILEADAENLDPEWAIRVARFAIQETE